MSDRVWEQRKTDITQTCYKCPDRVADPNCHGYCEKYLQAVKEHEELKEQIKQRKRFDKEYGSFKRISVGKVKKRARQHGKKV